MLRIHQNLFARVKKLVMPPVDLSDVSTKSVIPWDEGLGLFSSGKVVPMKSFI